MSAKTYLPTPVNRVTFSTPIRETIVERFNATQDRSGLPRTAFLDAVIEAGLDAIERELPAETAKPAEAAKG